MDSDAKCSCGCNTAKPVGMISIPVQQWKDLYDLKEGLSKGTIFSELDYPFLGDGGGADAGAR